MESDLNTWNCTSYGSQSLNVHRFPIDTVNMHFVSCQVQLSPHVLLLYTFFATTKHTDLFSIGRRQNACLRCHRC